MLLVKLFHLIDRVALSHTVNNTILILNFLSPYYLATRLVENCQWFFVGSPLPRPSSTQQVSYNLQTAILDFGKALCVD